MPKKNLYWENNWPPFVFPFLSFSSRLQKKNFPNNLPKNVPHNFPRGSQFHRANVFSKCILHDQPQKMLPQKKVALRAQRVFRTRPSIPRGQPGVFGAENLSPDRPNTVSNADRSRKRPFFHMQEVIYILSSRPLFNPGANLRIVPILTKLEQN